LRLAQSAFLDRRLTFRSNGRPGGIPRGATRVLNECRADYRAHVTHSIAQHSVPDSISRIRECRLLYAFRPLVIGGTERRQWVELSRSSCGSVRPTRDVAPRPQMGIGTSRPARLKIAARCAKYVALPYRLPPVLTALIIRSTFCRLTPLALVYVIAMVIPLAIAERVQRVFLAFLARVVLASAYTESTPRSWHAPLIHNALGRTSPPGYLPTSMQWRRCLSLHGPPEA